VTETSEMTGSGAYHVFLFGLDIRDWLDFRRMTRV
jgi:hypothetical protein